MLYTTKPAIGLDDVGAHGIYFVEKDRLFFSLLLMKMKQKLVSRFGRIAHIPRYIYSYQKVKAVYTSAICYLNACYTATYHHQTKLQKVNKFLSKFQQYRPAHPLHPFPKVQHYHLQYSQEMSFLRQ